MARLAGLTPVETRAWPDRPGPRRRTQPWSPPRSWRRVRNREDLLQQGAIGVMAAVSFDPARGYKFSTCATWWIRQSISRAVADKGAVIRIPVHLHEPIRKVAAAERKLEAEGRPRRAAHVAVACDLTVNRVEEIRRVSRRTTSLDRVIGDGVHLGDLVALDRPLPQRSTWRWRQRIART
ncbi:sigma factor [Streptomyces rubiginosohelvolus]|uniref:sigma factor n=1 Tax=Streptomyces rubiginosohelvolus TaxID=67362 RepID=UPI003719D5BC